MTDINSIAFLLDRMAIEDMYARLCRAIDRQDHDLMATCFFDDSFLEYGWFETTGKDFIERGRNRVHYPYTITQHQLGGSKYVEIVGRFAMVECYVHAFHTFDQDGREYLFECGTRYLDKLECRDGKWAIIHRKPVRDWARTSVVEARWPGPDDKPRPAWGAPSPTGPMHWGARFPDDPSYEAFARFRESTSED